MGIGQNLKDFYVSLEDGYYSVLDKVSNTLPVYTVVDPVDRVFPSFLLLILLVIAGIGFLTVSGFGPVVIGGDQVFVNVVVENRVGDKLPNVPVTLVINGVSTDRQTDQDGFLSFSAPKNSSGKLLISIEGYQNVDENFSISDQNVAKRLVLRQIELPKTRVIQFADAAGRAIIGTTITAKFTCSNTEAKLEKDTLSSDSLGKISIVEPANCGSLQATVLGPAEYAQTPFLVNQPSPVIRLEAVQQPVGNARIRVEDEQADLLSDLAASVVLYNDSGEVKRLSLENGFAQFRDVSVGSYYATVTPTQNGFGSGKSASFEVKEGQLVHATIKLSKSVRQNLTITVLDLESNLSVKDAKVVLQSRGTGKELYSKETDASGKAVFGLTDPEEWLVQASLADYYPDESVVSATDSFLTLKLEKISGENTGIVNVFVVDEKNKPVENAKVRLRYKETDSIAPYDALLTDVNGEAKYRGVKDGKELYGYAEKFPATGVSDAVLIQKLTPNQMKVKMEIGDALISVSAVTEDNEPIVESTAEIFDSTGERVGEIPLSNGSGSLSVKADKRIYVVVSNPDFFGYQSETFQLYKDKKVQVVAALPSRLVSGGPKVSLVGVFDASGKTVDQMEAGNNYMVRLQLKIPEDSSFEQAGIHFRVGSQALMENDQIVIKGINVANAALVQGSTFNPPKGQVIDLNPANQSFGDAKWANIVFSNPVPQVYNVAVDVRVKNTATLNAPIPMFYRAWGKTNQSTMVRDPQDNELGESFQTGRLQELYANAYPVTRFFEGAGSECDDYVCYSNVRFFDHNQGLYIQSPFELVNNRDYEFSFSLTNSSQANFSGASFQFSILTDGKESRDYVVSDYRISNASAQPFSGGSMANNKLEIDAGSMVVNAGISGSVKFRPTRILPGSILLKTVYQGEIVSLKEISFVTIADKKLVIGLSPDPIPALIEVPAVVSVAEEGNEEPVSEAVVTLIRETRDRVRQNQTKMSNTLGNAEFVIAASSPGTRIIVEAQKPNFISEPLVRVVDENVLLFYPNELSLALKTQSQREAEAKVTIENVTATQIRLSKLQLVGDFAGLLDQTKINGYLSTLIGTRVDPNSTQEVVLLKAFLSPTATLFSNQSLDASLAIEAVDSRLNTKWVFSVPVKISVSIDGMPENESCLSIDEPLWEDSSLENNLQHSFTLTNNCKVAGSALSLRGLASQVLWNDNAVGNVELTLTDASNPNNSITQVLRDNAWSHLFDQMSADGVYYGVLTFVPKSGKTGQEARFTVDFAAQTQTESGAKKLSTKEPITASILITNLQFCMQYSATGAGTRNVAEFPNPLNDSESTEPKPPDSNPSNGTVTAKPVNELVSASLQTATSDDEFTTVKLGTGNDAKLLIDMSRCGELPIDIVLCKGDDYCRGGTEDGGIQVKPLQFSLSPDTPVREVTVSRMEVPGIYGLTVWARTKGRNYNKVATIDVLVDPRTEDGQYFSLSKYELFIKGTGTKDSVVLKNSNYVTTTTVDAPASMWGQKKQPKDNGMGSMLPLLGAAMLPQMLPPLLDGMQGAFQGAKDLSNKNLGAVKEAQTACKKADAGVEKLNKGFDKEFSDPAGIINKSKTDLQGEFADDKGLTSQCETFQTIVNSCPTGCVSSSGVDDLMTKCNAAADGLKKSVDDSLLKEGENGGVLSNLDSQRDILSKLDSTATTTCGALPTGKFDKGAGISDQFKLQAETCGTQCQVLKDSITGPNGLDMFKKTVGDATKELGDYKKELSDLSDVSNNQALSEMASAKVTAFTEHMTEPSDVQYCTPCYAKADEALSTFNTAYKEKIQTVNQKVDTIEKQLSDQYGENGAAYKEAQQGLSDAQKSCGLGQQALTDQSKATPVVSDDAGMRRFDSGALSSMMSQVAMLGLMSGAMGNGFASDPTEDAPQEHVQQQQQVFAINLPSDARSTTMNNEGIGVSMDAENVKVMGKTDLRDQRVPVIFENAGLEEDKPTYAVMTIDAVEHVFDAVTKIPFGDSRFLQTDSWGLGQFFGKQQNYNQKFHLRFVSKDTLVELPPVIGDQFACTQGAMVGQTGPDALPRIKLKWNWTDITMDSCDAKNPEFIYCDATQFSIMMTKRLQAVNDFLAANPGIPCPTNWLEEQVQAELDPFNEYLVALDFREFQTSDYVTGCWLPKTTDMFDNKSALEFYVDDYKENIRWTDQVPNSQALHELLYFDAYLIQDGYTSDFRQDFAHYFSNVSFADTPSFFNQDPTGHNWSKYFSLEGITFTQKFTENDQLPTSGLYRVETVADFKNDDWAFFDGQTLNASINVGLLALQQSSLNSVFYYLPFDGEVGTEGQSLDRQGYGTGYEIANHQAVQISRQSGITTLANAGSNPVQVVEVSTGGSFDSLNAFASQRGFILDIENKDLTKKVLRFTPSLATPILLKVTQGATPEPFGAFYTIRNADIPQNLGQSAAYWSGAGACLDFSGNLVADAWDFRPDRKAQSSDRIPNWTISYGIDWSAAETAGDVFLKTVMYSPLNGRFSINAASDNVLIATPDQPFGKAQDLAGVSTMAFNRQGTTAQDRITALDDLFELVFEQKVCVTNTGIRSSFWWNPKTVFNQAGGSGSSISDIEATLQSGKTCR